MSIQTIETITDDLNQKGYCIVKNVLCKEEITNATELFYSWKNSIPDLDKIHSEKVLYDFIYNTILTFIN